MSEQFLTKHFVATIRPTKVVLKSNSDSVNIKLTTSKPSKLDHCLLTSSNFKFVIQPENGVTFGPDCDLTFRAFVELELKHEIQFFLKFSEPGSQNNSAFATINSRDFSNPDIKFRAAIRDQDGLFIGSLQADLLMINPLLGYRNRGAPTSPWRTEKTCLKIGHRGLGRSTSLKKEVNASVKENTVASIRQAGSSGKADMVEFDVQLTKDNVPVVFHNFEACKLKSESPVQFSPICQLTYSELQSNDYGHVHDQEFKDDERPFPTLQTLLETAEDKLGMNIEVKYPQDFRDGSSESTGVSVEINHFVDHVLSVVLSSRRNRVIFFSSFHPSIVQALALKQSEIPILFIVCNEDNFSDTRTTNVTSALAFAKSIGLSGVVTYAPNFLEAKNLYLQDSRSKGLVLLTYTHEDASDEDIKVLLNSGLDGVILDRIERLEN